MGAKGLIVARREDESEACSTGGSDSKNASYNAGDLVSTPGNGYPGQNSCLENSKDRGAWWATVHGVAKSQTRMSN